MDVSAIKLHRAVDVARRAISIARVLLQTCDMNEDKKEEISRWLVTSERDVIALDDPAAEGKRPVAPVPPPRSRTTTLLSADDQTVLRTYPQRSFAVVVGTAEEDGLERGTLVEVVCRMQDGMTMVRPARNAAVSAVRQVAHGKLVVVQESPAGVSWALAECEAMEEYVGAGPELSLSLGERIIAVKVNSNGWWKGLKGREAVAGLFPATAVRIVTVYSAQMTSFIKKLGRLYRQPDSDHPDAKFKLAFGAAVHNRGADEVSAYQMQAWNEGRGDKVPPVYLNTCRLEFAIDANGHAPVRTLSLSCPDMTGTMAPVEIRVLPPRLGPNLSDRAAFGFDPASFTLAESQTMEIRVSVAWATSSGSLDSTAGVVVPIAVRRGGAAGSGAGAWVRRYFVLCELTTPVLRRLDRMSLVVENDNSSLSANYSLSGNSSQVWGSTMSSADLAAAGIQDLLAGLVAMPAPPATVASPRSEDEAGGGLAEGNPQPQPRARGSRPVMPSSPPSVPPGTHLAKSSSGAGPSGGSMASSPLSRSTGTSPASAPTPGVSGGGGRVVHRASLVRTSDVARVAGITKQRTSSGGNRDDMPPEAGGTHSQPANSGVVMAGNVPLSSSGSETASPRSIFENVKARFVGRSDRSKSTGNEEDGAAPGSASPIVSSGSKGSFVRKSPRSPREDRAPSQPPLAKHASEPSVGGAGGGAKSPGLARADSPSGGASASKSPGVSRADTSPEGAVAAGGLAIRLREGGRVVPDHRRNSPKGALSPPPSLPPAGPPKKSLPRRPSSEMLDDDFVADELI